MPHCRPSGGGIHTTGGGVPHHDRFPEPYAPAIVDPRERTPEPDEPVSAEETETNGLVGQIIRWLAERRSDDAAAARTRERWLRQQAQEEGTFAGVLLDLGESQCAVVVHSAGDRRHRGAILAVAQDFAVVGTNGALDVLLHFSGIASVRQEPGSRDTAGDRTVALDTTLGEVLVGLAGERPQVFVVTLDGTGLSGQLRSVGRDVMTVRLEGEGRPSVYVPMASVAEVGLTDR